MMASLRSVAETRRRRSLLSSSDSGAASMNRSASAPASTVSPVEMRPRAASRSAASMRPFSTSLRVALLDAGHAPGDELVGHVDHDDLEAGLGRDLDDAGAHLAGAGHEQLPDAHVLLLRYATRGRARPTVCRSSLGRGATLLMFRRPRVDTGCRGPMPAAGRHQCYCSAAHGVQVPRQLRGRDAAARRCRIWHCRKRDPFVLGDSKEMALATCASCRLGDFTRPPAELAAEVERRNQELVALNAIVTAVNASLDLDTVLSMGLEKVIEILQVDAGWVSLAGDDSLRARRLPGSVARRSSRRSPRGTLGEGFVGADRAAAGDGRPRGHRRAARTSAATASRRSSACLSRRRARCSPCSSWARARREATRPTTSTSRPPPGRSSRRRSSAPSSSASRARASSASVASSRRRRPSTATSTRPRCAWSILSEAARLVEADKSALLQVRGDHLVADTVYRLPDDYRRLFVVPIADSLSGRAVTDGDDRRPSRTSTRSRWPTPRWSAPAASGRS